MIRLFLISFVINLLLGYLSYSFYRKEQAIKEQLNTCKEANLSLQKTIENQQKVEEAADVASTQLEENRVLEQGKSCDDVVQIMTMPSKEVMNEKQDKSIAHLDDSLPPDLTSVLNSTYSRVSGQDSSNP